MGWRHTGPSTADTGTGVRRMPTIDRKNIKHDLQKNWGFFLCLILFPLIIAVIGDVYYEMRDYLIGVSIAAVPAALVGLYARYRFRGWISFKSDDI
jgi:hypothetical protein